MDNIENVSVGVIPNSHDFTHPADRRRYLHYLISRGIRYEHAIFESSYSVLYVSINADLSKWSQYKEKELKKGNNTRVIFDLSDSYLQDKPLKDFLRGIFYYLSGQNSLFSLSYKENILRMLKGTDVLICTSQEQKDFLRKFHHNVVFARDYFRDDIHQPKSEYSLGKENTLNILWEGFSHGNLPIFALLKKILSGIKGYKIHVHFITDPEYCKIGTKYMCRPTYSILKDLFAKSDIKVHVYDWNSTTFSSIATSCDFALVPIPDDPVMMNKPENKLILLWSLGLPVIASKTASYSRVMNEIGEDYLCSSIAEFQEKIIEISESKDTRERYMSSASKYLQNHFSREAVMKTWDYVFFNIP